MQNSVLTKRKERRFLQTCCMNHQRKKVQHQKRKVQHQETKILNRKMTAQAPTVKTVQLILRQRTVFENMKNVIEFETYQSTTFQPKPRLKQHCHFTSTKLGSTETKVYTDETNLKAENAMQVTRIQILERMVASNNSIVDNSTATRVKLTLLQ